MTWLHCAQIGSAACHLLAPGTRGRVLAGVSQAAYLVTATGEVFWLAGPSVPMHTLGIRVTACPPRLAAGMPFSVAGSQLEIEGVLGVDLGAAPVWSARPAEWPVAPVLREASLRSAMDLDWTAARGWGQWIPRIVAVARGVQVTAPDATPAQARAWPAIHEIVEALLRRDWVGLWQPAEALLGLGEGLTPSGDDFLSGLLFCLNALPGAVPGGERYRAGQAQFVQWASPRTHPISLALLQCAAEGQSVEPLHEWLCAVCGDRHSATVRQAAARLTCIGHSTGWDMLAGALTGLASGFWKTTAECEAA